MILFVLVHSIAFSQTVLFKGIIRDEQSLMPVRDVNVKVSGTTRGTSTDHTGSFSLGLNKIPATLVISCVGYETAMYQIDGHHPSPVSFLLRPRSYALREVDILSKQYSFLFKNRDYSVLDYELTGDHILLLIFRYQLKRSELVLLGRSGDTLAISPLPEVPPASLFRDFLGNAHYFSKAKASYQCFYNEDAHRIEFSYKTSVDSLKSLVSPYLFKMTDRLYFQEKLAAGFGTAIGFIKQGTGKHYIRRFFNQDKVSEYRDDNTFYQKWNSIVPYQQYFTEPSEYDEPLAFDFTRADSSNIFYEKNEARAHKIEYYNMIYPVVKTGDETIAFFNFANDIIELMNENGKLIRTVPITFHKEYFATTGPVAPVVLSNPGWRWVSSILVDAYSRDVYTTFHRNGMVKATKIDLETGNLGPGTILPFPFPEKIEIYRGDAYFLVKSDGTGNKWKLVKCKL